MKRTVAVALSGGLDSSVAALLLKKARYRVIGLHLLTGFDEDIHPSAPARRIAEQIGIPFRTVDCRDAFKKAVVDYFVDTYAEGKTPSPCVVCNRRIKFDVLLKEARVQGASALATGHYAGTEKTADGRYLLKKGADRAKDQSYFLCRLTQDHLRQALFPLGGYQKAEVRAMAEAYGLASSGGRESQELCFVNTESYADFLSQYGNLSFPPGPILGLNGDLLGHHQGLHRYTIGQRRGIGIPGPEPYYVVAMDMKENILVIGPKSALRSRRCTVYDINWIGTDPPSQPLWAKTRLRYRHSEAGSVLFPKTDGRVNVVFASAQEAVTPGQAAVFYQGDKVLGGGWIT
jgi:tRNA-specific 2-thiouridylase